MDADFDIHDHRHRFKLLRDSGDTAVFENRDGARCPACGEPFDRLLLLRAETISFPDNAGVPFCLVRRADDLALFRH